MLIHAKHKHWWQAIVKQGSQDQAILFLLEHHIAWVPYEKTDNSKIEKGITRVKKQRSYKN